MSDLSRENLRLRNALEVIAKRNNVYCGETYAIAVAALGGDIEGKPARCNYSDEQKEWLARVLATNLASGLGDKTHKVNIDDWIKDVKAAFDMVDGLKSTQSKKA